ncbi:MAG TPA: amidohydrolase family protein [Streptosporangiaceae bacterium]|jgi:imidazolonepropionase-like amidohydrolase
MWLTDCTLLDVRTGAGRAGVSVSVEGASIGEVRRGDPPDGADVIELAGATLMPGLISCHTHLSIVFPLSETDEQENPALTAFRAAQRAKDALAAGVTTVRCVHEQHAVDLILRDAMRHEWFAGPRIVGAGRAVSTPDGHGKGTGCVYAEGEAAFFDRAAEQLEAGADHVKIFISGGLARSDEEDLDASEMTAQEMRGAVRAAQRYGKYVVAHSGAPRAIQMALAQGVRSFEHVYLLDAPTAGLVAGHGAFITPTLCVTHSPDFKRANRFPSASIEKSAQIAGRHMQSIRYAVEAGVTLVNGTDFPPGAPIGGGSTVVAREMSLMAQAGLSPLGVIQAATVNAARLCGLADVTGVVEAGLAADLIAVAGDPTADLRLLGQPTFVMARGRVAKCR